MWYKVKRIMVWQNWVEKQVRPYKYNPNENTKFYLPLKSDILDYSWNSVSTSWWWTITYQNPWALFTWALSIWYTQTLSNFTVVGYYKAPNTSTAVNIISQAYIVSGNYNWWDMSYNSSQNNTFRIEFLKPATTQVLQQFVYNVWSTSWHNIIVTVENSSNLKVYIDWVEKITGSVSWYNPYSINYAIWANSKSIYASEVILENKVRTATEITNYYNLTKSNYWL